MKEWSRYELRQPVQANQLERSLPKPVPTVESAAPIIIARLTAAGVKRGDNESWAEACAGAMGITVEELRRELMKRAYAV